MTDDCMWLLQAVDCTNLAVFTSYDIPYIRFMFSCGDDNYDNDHMVGRPWQITLANNGEILSQKLFCVI